jgi:large subunit ribosomal protein L29
MPDKRAAEIRDLPDAALVERLAETKDELFKLRFTHVTGQLDNYDRLRQLRRDVARVHTELRAREIAAHDAMAARATADEETS